MSIPAHCCATTRQQTVCRRVVLFRFLNFRLSPACKISHDSVPSLVYKNSAAAANNAWRKTHCCCCRLFSDQLSYATKRKQSRAVIPASGLSSGLSFLPTSVHAPGQKASRLSGVEHKIHRASKATRGGNAQLELPVFTRHQFAHRQLHRLSRHTQQHCSLCFGLLL